jgi:5'-3' exonuclease
MNKKYSELFKQVKEEHSNRANLNKNSKVLIIDGMNTYIRTFSASPALNDNGEHVGGYYGFINVLKNIIKLINPTRVIIVFDGKGGSQKRKKIYANYKEGRAIKNKLNRVLELDVNDEQKILKLQFIRLLEYLECLPITIMSYDYIEADDVIAFLATECLKEEVIIYSNDKDYYQLINDRISVYFPAKTKLYTKTDIITEYNILPENFIWQKVILGDKSDNVKGIRGVGIGKFNLAFSFLKEKIYSLDEFKEILLESDSKILNKVKNSIDIVERNYYIMQLSDVDISGNTKSKIINLLDGEPPQLNKPKLKTLMITDKLNSLIKNYEIWISNAFDKLNYYRNK